MFSPGDDQDDTVFDQLRSIRPFTVDQLYLIHADVGCPPKAAISVESADANDDQKFIIPQPDEELYRNLVEYEQLKNKLVELKDDIKKLYKKTYDHLDKAWSLKEESIRKVAMCQQGKIAEATFKFNKASIDKKQLSLFSQEFSELIDLITRDYIYYSYESQVKRNKILTDLSISYQTPDLEVRKTKLKSSIVTLFEFLRHTSDNKTNVVISCRKWLRALSKRYLDGGTTQDYRFIISQLAKSSVGAADWSADLFECKPYEQVSGFESVPQYITHCSTILSELFYSLQLRIKQLTKSTAATTGNTKEDVVNPSQSDQNWSLVDPRFSCAEEVSVATSNCNLLSESDVIKFCLKIPIAQIFRAHVKKCLEITNESLMETDKNYEYVMLKLLTIGTVIIKTYQIGLETFNSIQYGSLIEYLSSQLRRTVVILSDQWSEFKQRLRGIDDALLMRLQVEYDNFMLRSILIIRELRQSGIWRHLSRIECDAELQTYDNPLGWSTDSLRPALAKLLQVTGIAAAQPQQSTEKAEAVVDESKKSSRMLRRSSTSLTYEFSTEWFKDVSEPMLWHILWQFYHNAFVSSCDYHSDYYWLKKFREKSVIFLFVNKIKDSPLGECRYLLNSITSMLLSRTKPESKLVQFIAAEIFNLTFKNQSLKEKVSRMGLISLRRCAEKFPNLISLYLSSMDEDIDENAVELIKSCSLTGWICDDNEFALLESWLIEHQLSAPKNKIARLILYKLLLNSPQSRMSNTASPGNNTSSKQATTLAKPSELRRSSINNDCFVDLKMRRKLALVLYHASTVHLPENNQFGPQSLGASVEVAFGAGLCGNSDEKEPDNLLELSVDSSYQQFYIWTWRILFALRLHILHQIEADWNDVQMRSDSGNSNKNTVTANDPFYPVPSIIDPECSALAEGIKSQNSVASFVYLLLTDVTWHSDSVDSCLMNLNILADSGHITPSLMAMKFFTICHLNDLADRLVMDKRCINYFKKIIMSNFDATRLASLILTQLDHLKQYRQLQLSYFYIKVLLDVSNIVTKQMSASWFSSNEISLEKIACILDFIARFNFTQHRVELIRKFYDCAYVIQDQQHSQSNSWFGSLMPSNSPQRHFSTNLHILARKFKKYTWLQWVTTECDALRLEKVWEDIVAYLSTNEEANLDSAIKKFCPQINPALFRSILPIYSWVDLIFDIMETDLNHPLCPLIWYNFYLNYFANSLNGVSVGVKLISQETLTRLMDRLDSLHKYHSYKQKNWSSSSALQKNPSLTQLYQAYKLWLRDTSLHDAYVDIDSLGDQYLVPLLKAVMESSNANACLHYIDLDRIESQNKSLSHVWISSTRPLLSDQKNPIEDPIIYLDNNDLDDTQGDEFMQNEPADDAASLIARSHGIQPESKAARSLDDGQQELNKALDDDFFGEKKYRTGDELISLVKEQFSIVFEESTLFQLNISELNRTKTELIELVLRLYTNKKRTFVRVAPCIEGNECAGPARIKLEAEEALMDERKSQCIQDRRGQCQELVGELLVMPRNSCVKATILIEDNTKRLIDDPMRSKMVIETLLSWLSKSENYSQLNGSFCTANHLFKTVLEILSTSDQVDAYNHSIINVCLEHPESVQILSPYLSPCSCTAECFLDLYKTICSKQMTLGPMATFVMLSKFDIKSWLNTNSNKTKKAYHELIVTTCLAFKDIGKEPDKSNELTMDLFRRHLQIELAAPIREKPDELFLVLEQFLNLMDERVLAPNLWLDFLIIIGLNHDVKQEDCFKTTSITENVARLAECQTIFDHHSLCILIQTINQYLKDRCYESKRVTLLELYHDYIEQFGVMMLSVTFMWIKSTSDAMLVDNIDPIWKQFIGMWAEWVLPQASCKNNLNYNLLVDYFVYSMQYMVHKMSDSVQSILGSLLIELASYLRKLKDNLKLELTILQRSLKNLPWSCMLATPRDLENLAILSERTNHNMSDLVSHIMLQINIKESLAMLDQESTEVSVMAQSVEHLSNIIISQYEHLQGIQLPERYLCAINTNNIPKLASSMLARAEFLDTEGDQILFKLLKHICMGQNDLNTMVGLDRSQADNQSKQTTTLTFDTIERALIYARFVSDYLVVLIRRKPTLVQQTYPKLLTTVINNSLMDLEPILRSAYLSAEQRKILYATLLKCCNSDALDGNSRLMLAKLFAESNPMKNKPSLVVDMLQSIGQFLRDPKILVNMVEALVDLYFSITGHYDEVCKCFYLSSIQIDLYLDSCIRERSPMALMIYYESQLFCTSNQQSIDCVEATPVSSLPKSNVELYRGRAQLWPSYLFWLSQLIHRLSKRPSEASLISINAHKVTTILIRLLIAFESDLEQFVLKDCLFDGNGHHSILPHSDHAGPMETMNGDNMNGLEQKNDHDQSNTANNSSILATGAASQTKSSARPTTSNLSGGHRCLLGLIKELTSFYDSFNSGGLWSYLKSSNKSEQSVKISITSLTVACFLADRSLLHLAKVTQEAPAQLKLLRDELVKSRRVCLAKLESLRKSKSSMDYSQFLDSFIESVQQNIKVQYGEVVQLITTFELAH